MPYRLEEQAGRRFWPAGVWPWTAIALTLAVFGATVWFVTLKLEAEVRRQTVARDGEVLQAVMVMQQLAEQEEDSTFTPRDEAAQFQLLLKASRLKGVMGARLYDPQGRFVAAFPEYVPPASLAEKDLAELRRLRPVSRLDDGKHPWLASASGQSAESLADLPVLEVIAPIHESNRRELLGVAQFITDGRTVAERLKTLHDALLLQALLVFVVGSGLISVSLGWTMNRLQRRTLQLVRANRELALAAKTAAVGAISAQLIHGLKSPLFGLQSLLSGRAEDSEPDPAWQSALRAMRRMRETINRVMGMLRDQEGLEHLDRPAEQLAADLRRSLGPLAAEKGVRLEIGPAPDVELPAQVSNLVQIILTNLLQNAIEATPDNQCVCLTTTRTPGGDLLFAVRDEGSGLSRLAREGLYLPCESAKESGGGVGLSISRQLAVHLNGDLRLRSTGPGGSVFEFQLPASKLGGEAGGERQSLDSQLVV
jgi:signal transduction histidine kinase